MEFYNNKIAKFLFQFTGNDSIAIGPFLLFSRYENEVTAARLRHLEIHSRQWFEVTLTSMTLSLMLSGLNIGGFIISLFIYYIWWIIEFLIRGLVGAMSGLYVDTVAFEQEADESEGSDYLAKKLFGWVKYLGN